MTVLEPILRSGLVGLDQDYDDHQVVALLAYVSELKQWNRAYNLTAIREPEQMVDRHLLDSLAIAQFVTGSTALDVGAGAGLPGVPLAIVQPQRQFTLLDSNGKKVRFMRHVVRTLGLTNVGIVQARIEQYRPESPPDCVTARAFAPVEELARLLAPVCRSGTRLLAMRGRNEPFTLPDGFKQLENRGLKVPRSAAPRHILILERE